MASEVLAPQPSLFRAVIHSTVRFPKFWDRCLVEKVPYAIVASFKNPLEAKHSSEQSRIHSESTGHLGKNAKLENKIDDRMEGIFSSLCPRLLVSKVHTVATVTNARRCITSSPEIPDILLPRLLPVALSGLRCEHARFI